MDDPKVLYEEALRFFKADRPDQAVSLLERAYKIAPQNPEIVEALGVICGRLNRIDEAIELMKKLSELDPNHVMARANLSQLYARKGMIQEAEHEQAEARLLSWKAELRAKKLPDSEIDKISLEDETQKEEILQRKIAQYKKAIAYDPNDVLGYFTLATAYLQGKRYAEAAETFQKAVEVNPDHSPSYVGLGEALEALGRKDEAIQIYKQGILVADRKGDIVPLRKMESRLRKLTG